MVAPELAKLLELVVVRPNATHAELDAACDTARDLHCASIMLLPCFVARAAARLTGSDVRVCAALGFPYGADTTRTKATAADDAVRDGAAEVEVVAPIHRLVVGDAAAARDELATVVRVVRRAERTREVLVKAVVEAYYLDAAGLRAAGVACAEAGCDLVVTSTGLAPEGATEQSVRVLRDALPPSTGVEAQGGVISLADVRLLEEAGATRFGTRDPAVILDEARERPRR